MSYQTPDDDAFTAFVNSQKAKAEEKRPSGNFVPFDYETVKCVAAPKGGYAIVRFVGGTPKETPNPEQPTDAIERHVSKIKDDNGKIMYLTLPTREENGDFIIWRIIDRIRHKTWVNKKPIYDVQQNHPEVWEIVDKGGFKPEDDTPKYKAYTWADGWNAKRKLFINCIDRLDDWCKENKHTKVFVKNVSVSSKTDENGVEQVVEYPDKGVNSNGFLNALYDNVSKYKISWERFDSFVVRVGTKEQPFKILNASKWKSMDDKTEMDGIEDADWNRISTLNELSDEEKDYERYDLQKNYPVTSYHKLLTRLGKQIKTIDAGLGTTYYDELVALEKEEAEDRAREKEAKEMAANLATTTPVTPTATEQTVTNTDGETKTTPVEPAAPAAMTARRVVESAAPAPKTNLTPEKIAALKGWESLSDEEKSFISDVVLNSDGTVKEVVYTEDAAALLDCPTAEGGCGSMSPSTFTLCPVCGKHFC